LSLSITLDSSKLSGRRSLDIKFEGASGLIAGETTLSSFFMKDKTDRDKPAEGIYSLLGESLFNSDFFGVYSLY
jgi:hypothetical protein